MRRSLTATHLENTGQARVGDEVQEGRAGEVVHVGVFNGGWVSGCLCLVEVALQAGAADAGAEGGGEVVGGALRGGTHWAGGGLELVKERLDQALWGEIVGRVKNGQNTVMRIEAWGPL